MLPVARKVQEPAQAAEQREYLRCMRASRVYALEETVYQHPLGGAPMYCRTDACAADAEKARVWCAPRRFLERR